MARGLIKAAAYGLITLSCLGQAARLRANNEAILSGQTAGKSNAPHKSSHKHSHKSSHNSSPKKKQNIECKKPKASKCSHLVKASIQQLDHAGVNEPGARIGGVLGNATGLMEKCCKPGTEYERFVHKLPGIQRKDLKVDNETAIFIIDVQQDFTVGSFAQACWGSFGPGFMEGIGSLVKRANKHGATIIASKDFHSPDHCSFNANCKNQKNYKRLKMERGQRYINDFPNHCTFHFEKGSKYAVPQRAPENPFCVGLKKNVFKGKVPPGHFCGKKKFKGAAFYPKLETILKKASAKHVEVVFKGFNKHYDSFSASPHIQGNHTPQKEEVKYTGGYAIPAARAAKCHGKWNRPKCHPTKEEMEHPDKHMRSVVDILNERKIKRIIVTGLVFDFCVKETSMFAMEAAAEAKAGRYGWNAAGHAEAHVLAHLARPSFDGKPGAPYSAAACHNSPAGGAHKGNYCTRGSGTTALYKKVLKDYHSKGVKVVKFKCKGR